jgi:hypothetical protein
MSKVSKAKAEQVLKSVRKAFAPYVTDQYGPTLVEDWDGEGWAVVWEDGAPYEWALLYGGLAAGYEVTEEEFGFKFKPVKKVTGVYTEPYYSYVLSIYPE